MRVALFSANGFGLGHVRPLLNIANALSERQVSVSTLLITGNRAAGYVGATEDLDYVKLPSLVKPLTSMTRGSPIPGWTREDVLHLRQTLTLSTLRNFRPEVLIVHHLPLGADGELLPTLQALRSQERVRTVLCLRDIYGSPAFTAEQWRQYRFAELVPRLYDDVFVLGVPSVFDWRREYRGILGETAPMLRYAGYAARIVPRQPQRKDRKGTLISLGGGGGSYPLLSELMRMRFPTNDVTLIGGPLLSSGDDTRLRKECRKLRWRYKSVVRDLLPELVACSRAIVGGGDNTLCEAVLAGPAVFSLVKRQKSNEQRVRADRFGQYGVVSGDIEGWLNQQAMPEPHTGIRETDFHGAHYVASTLLEGGPIGTVRTGQ